MKIPGVVAAIRIRYEGGTALIEINPETDVRGGLAVHRTVRAYGAGEPLPDPKGGWNVTHIASGYAVASDIHSEEAAREAMAHLAAAIDWTPKAVLTDAHREAKERASEAYDTVVLRQKRLRVAEQLGFGADLLEQSPAMQLTATEVRTAAAITNTGESASDIARSALPNVIREMPEDAVRGTLKVLNRLERLGIVERRAGKPVTWYLKVPNR